MFDLMFAINSRSQFDMSCGQKKCPNSVHHLFQFVNACPYMVSEFALLAFHHKFNTGSKPMGFCSCMNPPPLPAISLCGLTTTAINPAHFDEWLEVASSNDRVNITTG